MQPLSTVDRLRKLNALLDEALDMPAEQRDAWLAGLPVESQSLAPELRVLLAHQHIDTGDVIPRGAHALLDAPASGAEAPGDVIGPYRLLTQLGHGGMSTVWRAERCDGSLQREVALKLPHTGWAYGFARRMAHERDILALLEHPRIAARIAFLSDDLRRSQRLIDEASAARSPDGGVVEGGVTDTDLQITQARLWQRTGRNDEARAVFTKMLDQLAASGSQGSLGASLLTFRSQTLAAQNRSAEALADAKQALPIARAAQGDQPYSITTGNVWLSLAKYQHQLGQHAEARLSVANALENLEAMLDGDHRLVREGRELAAALAKSAAGEGG